jgi:predicted alpha-1,6-mannanase (GH76 family)
MGTTMATGLKEAVDALNGMMSTYSQDTGLWDLRAPNATSWWQSGIALQAVLDFMHTTGTRDYVSIANYTIGAQRAPLAWWPQGGGDFRGDSTDDTGWWALAITSMYALTGEEWLLDIARDDEAYMSSYWTTSLCDGGVIWRIPDAPYKNAISNELYLELTATLHNLIPGDTTYLNQSLVVWDWIRNSGMINNNWLVNDGLMRGTDGNCINNNAPTWTYNQGVILGGLVELYKATGDGEYIQTAQNIADTVLASSELSPGGILTEPCPPEGCDLNGSAFKGIFVRYLAKLNEQVQDRRYSDYISENANTAYNSARSSDGSGADFYGMKWNGPYDTYSLGRQESAVMLLVAANQY